jgi:hypothetical protein
LHNGVAPLFLELRSGKILIEAEGDHSLGYQPVTLPVEFWCSANWVLYRASPLDPATSQLVAFDPAGDELSPAYYNPRLILPHGASLPRTETTVLQAVRSAAGKRPGPRSQSAEMVRALELALQRGTIGRGMTQKAIHRAMLDALKFTSQPIPRGFDIDAFRKNCRWWLIRHGLVHDKG